MLQFAEPLFIDPYAGCFLLPNAEKDMDQNPHHYCLATKFIDDKLLSTMNHIDGLNQVFLPLPISKHRPLDQYLPFLLSFLSSPLILDRWFY